MTATATATPTVPAPTPTKPAATQDADPRPLILGIIPKGELRHVLLSSVIDPKGPSDRITRPEDDAQVEELARSLREVGQLQPIMVEELADGRYCRVFGRRRLEAARRNLKNHADAPTEILARIVPPLPDEVRRTIVAIENMQRKDLTPAEEHLAVGELLELVALDAAAAGKLWIPGLQGKALTPSVLKEIKADPAVFRSVSHNALREVKIRSAAVDVVAAMLAKTRAWVLDRLYIARLGKKAQQLIRDGKLPLPHAREISKVADPAVRESLAESYAAGGDDSRSDVEAGDLADLRDAVSQNLFSLRQVAWRLDVPFADKPACEGCEHNSASHPGLFDGTGLGVSTEVRQEQGSGFYGSDAEARRLHERGVCTLHSCFIHKTAAAKSAVAAAAKKKEDGGEVTIKPFIEPAAVDRKVKERKERAKHRPQAGKSPEKLAAEREKYEATEAFHNAMRAWNTAASDKLAALINDNPWGKVWVELRGLRNGRHLEVEEYRQAATATEASVKKLLAGIVAKPRTVDKEWPEWGEAAVKQARKLELAASACKVTLAKKPTLEEFLPKKPAKDAKEEKAEKPAAKTAPKKPSKKKGGKKGKKA